MFSVLVGFGLAVLPGRTRMTAGAMSKPRFASGGYSV